MCQKLCNTDDASRTRKSKQNFAEARTHNQHNRRNEGFSRNEQFLLFYVVVLVGVRRADHGQVHGGDPREGGPARRGKQPCVNQGTPIRGADALRHGVSVVIVVVLVVVTIVL